MTLYGARGEDDSSYQTYRAEYAPINDDSSCKEKGKLVFLLALLPSLKEVMLWVIVSTLIALALVPI